MTATTANAYEGRHRNVTLRNRRRSVPPLLMGATWLVGAVLLAAAATAVLVGALAVSGLATMSH